MEIFLNVLIGIGLAATCGFRVFVPFLMLGIAAATGYLNLNAAFQWIGTYPAIIVFGVATLFEILAYFFPFVDNFLSAVNMPISIGAGVLITAAVTTDVSPLLQWTLAIIAGGGAAAATSLVSNGIHHSTTLVSGGTANPFVSAVESIAALIISALSVAVPFIAVFLIAITVFFISKRLMQIKRKLAA